MAPVINFYKRGDPRGVIYAIQSVHGGPVKIGWVSTPARLNKRLRILQCGHPDVLEIVWTTAGDLKDEKALHAEFEASHLRGEWFNPTPEIVLLIDAYGGMNFPHHARRRAS